MPCSRRFLDSLREEWAQCHGAALKGDPKKKDHAKIAAWVLDFLDGEIKTSKDQSLVGLINRSINPDIPMRFTTNQRRQLIAEVRKRMRMERVVSIVRYAAVFILLSALVHQAADMAVILTGRR